MIQGKKKRREGGMDGKRTGDRADVESCKCRNEIPLHIRDKDLFHVMVPNNTTFKNSPLLKKYVIFMWRVWTLCTVGHPTFLLL